MFAASSLEELRSTADGPVLVPSDDGFADEVRAFNLAAVNTPEVVVGATSSADVAAAVRFATANDLVVRIQATGHGAHGLDGGVLVNTARLDRLEIDGTTAIVGAGVKAGAVLVAAAEHGLTAVTGASPTVGIVGFLLGGGFGPIVRSHGFGSDYVRGLTVVTADGEIVTANADENPDLFWALRGGKGGFGVVTEVRLELVPLTELYAGSMFFGADDIERVLRGWIEWTADAPTDVSTSVAILRLPPLDAIPEPLRGRTVINLRFAYPGDAPTGERLAAPLRSLAPAIMDTIGVLPTAQMGRIHNDPDQPTAGWTTGFTLSSADQEYATTLLSQVGPGVEVPLVAVEMRQLGGRAAVDVPGGSATGGRSSAFSFTAVGVPDPSLFHGVLPGVASGLRAALAAWISPETVINNSGNPPTLAEYESAWSAATRQRLAEVRERHDPRGIFTYAPSAG